MKEITQFFKKKSFFKNNLKSDKFSQSEYANIRYERLYDCLLCLFCRTNGLILRPNLCWQNHSDSQQVSALTGLLFAPFINLWESSEGRTALISNFKLWVSFIEALRGTWKKKSIF